MNTLIIYDSTFGNTAQLAQAMADKLGEHGTVRIALAHEAGLTEVKEPESFFVTEREGPLEEGELERAARWAEEIFKQFDTAKSVQKDKAEAR